MSVQRRQDPTEYDSAADFWQSHFDDSRVDPDRDDLAERVADELGLVDHDDAAEVCEEAVMIAVDDHATAVSLDHVLNAASLVQPSEPTATDTDTESADTVPEPGTDEAVEFIAANNDADESVGEVVDTVDGVEETEADAGDDVDKTDTETLADAVQDDPEPEPGSEAAHEPDQQTHREAHTDGEWTDPAPIHGRERAELERQVAEQQADVQELTALVEALRRQVKQQSQLIVGEERINLAVDPDEVVDHHEQITDVQDRLATVEGRVDPNPGSKAYGDMSRDEKVRKIRVTLLKDAMESNGHAGMGYQDIRTLFGNNPSKGHAYDLMRLAGDYGGYEHEDPADKSQRVTVDAEAVNDESLVHAANNDRGGEGV